MLSSFPDREVDLQLYRPHAVGVLSQETYGDEYYQYIDQVGQQKYRTPPTVDRMIAFA